MSEAGSVSTLTAPGLKDFAAQGAVYRGLMHSLESGTAVHAYLLCGMSGVGKRTLANLIGQYLLCSAGADEGMLSGLGLPPQEKPCGHCPGCVRFLDDTHPDVLRIRPEKSISVEVIRELVKQCGEHTYVGGKRIIILEQADKMTSGAQNSLLKTLEEPQAENVFFLLTEDAGLLLPTIVSRCRVLKLHPWPDSVVETALKNAHAPEERIPETVRLAGGSIGQALQTATDDSWWQRRREVMQDFFGLKNRSGILAVSTKLKDKRDRSEELLRDVEDMIRTVEMVHLGLLDKVHLRDYPPAWQRMAQNADAKTFAHLMDAVFEARRLRASQVTWQAVVERLLLHMTEESTKWLT